MANSTLIAPKLEVCTFKRREHLPLRENSLWQIEAGAVRTYTLTEDGTVIVLGFWGLEDVIGHPLALIQPYEVECLTDVRVRAIQPKKCDRLNQVLSSHLYQTQTLLRLRSGQIHQRLQQLLDWLADQFGHEADQGQLIHLRLTHQDIADTLGTTRVTVTRLLSQFEQQGRIRWIGQYLLLPRSLQIR
ncbi:MAG: Crp/Fnr family transcriptional regulator [Leptolyngbyaceae cyanobacterium HOT.MB2.61]|nr:Crp/Fnr family transcriptional regulator [Leptolyngbyaceae cyanobacterium HOT.MB2.61]